MAGLTKYVVFTENHGPQLVEATTLAEAITGTPGGESGRIAMQIDLRRAAQREEEKDE